MNRRTLVPNYWYAMKPARTRQSVTTDLENLRVSSSPAFRALIEMSRRENPPGTGLTTEEVRGALAKRRATRRKRAWRTKLVGSRSLAASSDGGID